MDLEKDINGLGLTLPDIAKETRIELTGNLDRVGMSEIEVPVLISKQNGIAFLAPAKANAYVSLDDPNAKGIHMSRLFLQLQEGLVNTPLSFALLEQLLNKFIDSHQGLSCSSAIEVAFDYMVERPALVSANKGWRAYPLVLAAIREKDKTYFDFHFKITYSSTCPCSAALARKLIQDHFVNDFKDEMVRKEDVRQWLGTTQGVLATPHSQRSVAEIQLRFESSVQLAQAQEWTQVIDEIEKRLGTPVQAAVKREDEQEFALLNGQNLMFCEDAARKIKHSIESMSFVTDYHVKVSHLESLHPHNAVSIVTKGLPSGLKP